MSRNYIAQPLAPSELNVYELVDGKLMTKLGSAIERKDRQAALRLIEAGADLWRRDPSGVTVISYADNKEFRNSLRRAAFDYSPASRGVFSFFKKAPDYLGERITLDDLTKLSKIVDSHSSENAKWKKVSKFINQKDTVHYDRSYLGRILELAEFDESRKDDVVKVASFILQKNPDIYTTYYRGYEGFSDNIFHLIAKYNIPELIASVLEATPEAVKEINNLNNQKLSPLTIAKENGFVEVARVLIERGAVDKKNPRTDSALTESEGGSVLGEEEDGQQKKKESRVSFSLNLAEIAEVKENKEGIKITTV